MCAAESEPTADDRPKQSHSEQVLTALAPFAQVILVSHVHPDPDGIASMMGMAELVEKRLDQKTTLTRDGIVSRAENKAMVRLLSIPLVPIEEVDWPADAAVVMVDCQPAPERQHLPRGLTPHVVLDHHDTRGDLKGVGCWDIRAAMGATSTMVTGYLDEQRIDVSQRLATALFYGIESETGGYPRGATELDDAALAKLYPLVDRDVLAAIRNARLPQSYFGSFLAGLQQSFIYDKLIVCWMGELEQPDLTAELAEFLLRFEEVRWAFCGGVYDKQFLISFRSSLPRARAGEMLAEVVGELGSAGGHDKRAGGSIPLTSTAASAIDDLQAQLRRRLLEVLDIDERRGERLVSKKAILEGL